MTTPDDTLRIAVHPILGVEGREARVEFTFDERQLTALAGESIASALRANGVNVFRTMPESRSPRGLFCGVGRCPDCMMTVDGRLNVRACVTPVRDQMIVETQQELGIWTMPE